MDDPFAVLGVGEDAGDDQIKRRYLALVRAFLSIRIQLRPPFRVQK